MRVYKVIKFILQIIPFISILVIFDPTSYSQFWDLAWKFLILLLFLRPIMNVFPEYNFLKLAVSLRKELGIISWIFAIAHVFWYFLLHKLPATFLLDSIMWDPRWYLGWWMFSLILAIVLTATSNIFSIKKFWKQWKLIQRLSYFMLLFTAIHIALVKQWELIPSIIIVSSYIVVYFLAYTYKKI